MTTLCIPELQQIHLYRQHLTAPTDKITAVQNLCGVQAQFMSNAFHALRIRITDYDAATLGKGLVKNWTIRGTVHVFAETDLPLFLHARNGEDYLKNEWNGYRFWNRRDGWSLTPARQKYFTNVILDACSRTSRTREELKEICTAAGMTADESRSMFDEWGGGIREMCERGFLNYTVQEQKAFCIAPSFTPIPEEEAMLEICRRYLTHMAPATIEDICYYFKCTKRQAKAWLHALPTQTLSVNGIAYYYLGEIEDCPPMPRCLLLSGFDPLMLAYEKKTSLYLPAAYLREIFNLAGIVMPSVLLDGKVAGRWKKTGSKLTVYLFRALTEAEKCAIKDYAESLWETEIRTVQFM